MRSVGDNEYVVGDNEYVLLEITEISLKCEILH